MEFPSCKQRTWVDFDIKYQCRKCQYINNEQKHQINSRVLRQDKKFSTRLRYATKRICEIKYSIR